MNGLGPENPSGGEAKGGASSLGMALSGSLPCLGCGYDLQGMSIAGVCPECGTLVRATILSKVDPEAEALRPLLHPRLLACALVVWSAGLLVSAAALWVLRLADAAGQVMASPPGVAWARWVAVGGGALSGVALLGVARTSRGEPAWRSVLVVVGSLLYVPGLWALWTLLFVVDARMGVPYLEADPNPARVWLRVVVHLLLALSLLAVRPTARELVRRSLVLRTGRVDRQTILAMVVVLAVVTAGDVLRLASLWWDEGLLELVGTLLILIGSGFLTLGLAGALVDSWRIRRSILTPAPSLREVLGGGGGS